MAKKSSIEKNARRIKLAKQIAPRRSRLKQIAIDRTAPPEERFAAQLKLAMLPRNSSPTRVRNRCALTGRPRGFYRKFKLSRIALREFASSGQIPGMLKSSWYRNGQRARQAVVASPASKIRANVLEVLKREGYIRGFTREDLRPGVAELKIELKYVDGEPVIREINRISKPGRRIYSRIADLPRSYNGLGIAILSTPRGVLSDNEARAAKVGGEVLCRVF
jgi:small subunit ribosomal protein S8